MTDDSGDDKREGREKLERALKWSLENWDCLGVVASEQGLLLPVKLRVRNVKGKLDEKSGYLMTVDGERVIAARKKARKWAEKLELDPDRTETGKDRDVVRRLEEYEELAYALRDDHDEGCARGDKCACPFIQMYPTGESLFRAVRNPGTMQELYEQLDTWTQMNDPRYGELDAEQLWKVGAEMVKTGTALPLAGIDGRAQIGCILLLARAAFQSPSAPSELLSPTT